MENGVERNIEQQSCSPETGNRLVELINSLHNFGYEDAVAYSSVNLTDLVMIYPESVDVGEFSAVPNAKFVDIGLNRNLNIDSNQPVDGDEISENIRVSEVSYWSDSEISYYYISHEGQVFKVQIFKSPEGKDSSQYFSAPSEAEVTRVIKDLERVQENAKPLK